MNISNTTGIHAPQDGDCRVDRDQRASRRARRLGFTITELLVVIGIIVLLASILLVALGKVRTTALRTSTLSTMSGFAQACDAFHAEHGIYPGVIPEQALARAIDNNQVTLIGGGGGQTSFSSTENALLQLMGGYRVSSPTDRANNTITQQEYDDFEADYEFRFGTGGSAWELKVNLRQIGEGPIVDRRPYPPYFTPGANELAVIQGQVNYGASPEVTSVRLPDLRDAWGQPILYFRQARTNGPITGLVSGSGDDPVNPQFYLEPQLAYLRSTSLGELGRNQIFTDQNASGSIFTVPTGPIPQRANLAQVLRHPSFGVWDEHPITNLQNQREIRARGAYALMSAGPNGVYFSAADGPGTYGNPVVNLAGDNYAQPQIIGEYDDVLFFGGG